LPLGDFLIYGGDPVVEERAKRKLSAILSADVKGYSRLMGENELATVRTLEAYRAMIAEVIRNYSGRVVDSPGDNVLAEFASVVDAVESAVDIQNELKTKNAELPEDRRMEFRIGINLGDVIEEGERIYGDGVNVAARIEGLAEGGAICISSNSYEQVKNKLNLGYQYLGEHSVKNIAEPVRVYSVLMEPEAAGKVIGEERPRPKQWRWAAIGTVAVLVIVAGALVIWNFYFRTPLEPASVERMAFPLPDKPSIAVLQEYFSDGITEDLITDLSKISGLFVIARNSVFTYKGKAVKVEKVGQELGVKYVLKGSVRKVKNRVRITAQLVDTTTGGHLWAERYDRDLRDILALQDEVTQKIVTALVVKLTKDEQERLVRKGTDSLEAYDYTLRGMNYFCRFTKEANARARQMFEKATDLDPKYALAHTWLGWTHWLDYSFGWSQNPKSLEGAFELAQRATSLDDSVSEAHALLGKVHLWKRQHDLAIAELEKTLSLNPNYADGLTGLGEALYFAGRPEEAIGLVKKAMRLNPKYPVWYLLNLGHAYFLTGRYEEAITTLKRVINRNPNFWPAYIYLAASYVELGQEEKSRIEASELLRINPNFSLEAGRKRLPYKDKAVLEHLFDILRKTGLK
jgi:TolB-like protein/class 3 adenylate cyclase